jgi:hypothetical protein
VTLRRCNDDGSLQPAAQLDDQVVAGADQPRKGMLEGFTDTAPRPVSG